MKLSVCLVVVLLVAQAAYAGHPANIPSVKAKLGVDGVLELRMRFDLLAYLLEMTPAEVADGPMNALLDGPKSGLQAKVDESKERLRRAVVILTDVGISPIESIDFPTVIEIKQIADSHPKQRLPVMATTVIRTHVRHGTKRFALMFPDSLGTVVLTSEFPYREPSSEPVEPGSWSTRMEIPSAQEVAKTAKVMLAPRSHAAAAVAPIAKPPAPKVTRSDRSYGSHGSDRSHKPDRSDTSDRYLIRKPLTAIRQPPTLSLPEQSNHPTWFQVFPQYVKMGFLHILPEGLDHILFVLGLFLLSKRMKDLLKQITAFTVAHSLTLALSLYGIVRLPSSIVEPIIALSIVFVAVENLLTTEVKAWRVYVVFLFGLVHGLGFASALQDAGLQKNDFLTALVGFNSGVELGQLSVVAGAFLLVGWFRSNPRYRQMVAIPASLSIACMAVIWSIERIW